MKAEDRLLRRGLFGPVKEHLIGALRQRFLIPPFTVLNCREGYWQQRKRAWIRLGIKGEEGRCEEKVDADKTQAIKSQDRLNEFRVRTKSSNGAWGTTFGSGAPGDLSQTYAKGKKRPRLAPGGGGCWLGGEVTASTPNYYDQSTCSEKYNKGAGTSVFDPVLCELVYRWFCPPGGHVLDPFAGESTKGIVATVLGRGYTGVELRQEQIDANNAQAATIGVAPCWVQGDSANVGGLLPDGALYDLVFTSPPYYDLEVYSTKREDGSAMQTYGDFMRWYVGIFQQCVERLRENRFLVVKVGEIRDGRGVYRNFVGDNVRCFTRHCGLAYYNEAILVTAVGSLPIRAGKQFSRGRKLGKTHQNILVFYKGNPACIKDHFPELAYGD